MKLASSHFVRLLAFGATLAMASTQAGCGGDSDSSKGGGGSTSTNAGGGGSGGGAGGGTGGTGGQATGGGGSGGSSLPFGAAENKWTFVPIEGSKCINNTDTGIGVNVTSSSEDVVIYLEGGNACFNFTSCAITYNTKGYGETEFNKDVSMTLDSAPFFSRTNGSLLKDYNYVFVPYCTGDVHAGDNEANIGGTMRYFHGARNMDLYLARIKAELPHVKRIILAGSSAGGFGAAVNYDRTAKVFPDVKVALIDDSGPPLAEAFVPACLQQYFVDTWGLNHTFPAGCTECGATNGVFMEPLVSYIKATYSDRRLSIVSSSEDATISRFWGYGDTPAGGAPCDGINNPVGDPTSNKVTAPGPYPGSEYASGLEDLRDRIIADVPNFKMFLIDGTDGGDNTHHVWLSPGSGYSGDPADAKSNGTNLNVFLTKMLGGDADWANVPTTGE